MEPLVIEKTDDTPGIHFDPAQNIFQIAGKSMPEDPVKFYSKVFDWINSYSAEVDSGTSILLNVRFDYFNTASSKLFLDLLDIFAELTESGATVKVLWNYRKGDDDMKDAGEEYAEMVEIPFDFKEN